MLWRLNRAKNANPALEAVDSSSLFYEPERRRVILFPGAGIYDQGDSHVKAGSIKYIEQTIGKIPKATDAPPDILLYSYEEPYQNFGAKRNHYHLGKAQSHYGLNAARHVLLPLLVAPGERLSTIAPAELKQRLSKLTLVGHSYGSIAIQDAINGLVHLLIVAGWEHDAIADTMKELVSVCVAPIARTDVPRPNATQFFFNAVNDMTAIDSIRNANPEYQTYIPLLRACGYGHAANAIGELGEDVRRPQIVEHITNACEKSRRPGVAPRASVKPEPNRYVISALLPDKEVRWMEKRADGSEQCRVLNDAEVARTQVAVAHDYRTFLHGEHKLGEVLINVVNHAVTRDVGIGDGHQLMLNSAQTKRQQAERLASHALAYPESRSKPAETPRR